jgi:hypothetical protein
VKLQTSERNHRAERGATIGELPTLSTQPFVIICVRGNGASAANVRAFRTRRPLFHTDMSRAFTSPLGRLLKSHTTRETFRTFIETDLRYMDDLPGVSGDRAVVSRVVLKISRNLPCMERRLIGARGVRVDLLLGKSSSVSAPIAPFLAGISSLSSRRAGRALTAL